MSISTPEHCIRRPKITIRSPESIARQEYGWGAFFSKFRHEFTGITRSVEVCCRVVGKPDITLVWPGSSGNGQEAFARILRNLDFTEKGRNDTICEEHAEVAQLVEQLIRNQQVVGSSPTFGSIPFRFNPKTPENLRQVVSSSLFHRARPLRARVNQVRYRLSTHFLLRH